MRQWNRRAVLRALAAGVLAAGAGGARAQERFSVFVGSDPKNVERMVALAGLRDNDVVIDLGAGDGRIVFQALRSNPTVRGVGVDIDAKLVKQASQTAQTEGFADRVEFQHRNAFDADLSGVTVIFMWLFPELQRLLRTKILAEARPGTRVVTNIWDMGSWPPDAVDRNGSEVNLWVVPARVAGNWTWELPVAGARRTYAAVFDQRFQTLEGVVRVGARRDLFNDLKLRGEEISFTLGMTLSGLGYARHEFTGRVRGETMEGVAKVTLPPKTKDEDEALETVVLPWRAKRTGTSAYFEPTGVNLQ